jgi:fatty acid desaturase
LERFNSLDEDKAKAIADALLAKERRPNAQSWGRRVPFFIRTAESAHLAREQEWELFRQARRNIFAARGASLAVVAAPVVLLVLFWFFMRHPVSAWYVAALDVGLLVPIFLVVFHLRKELAKLSRAQK